ncbi:amidase family protein [Motilibacter deserti]|uniref:Amidase n=1 Tax=Motilibacter deserti TaxID=2714956 RepID=A0ABX0GVT8_9ACTN|nr:amidase [Motilibacter deserti]
MSLLSLSRRRQFAALGAASVLAGLGATLATTGDSAVADSHPTTDLFDIETVTVPELQSLLTAKKIDAVDLAELYLERIEQINSKGPSINAVQIINPNWKREAKDTDQLRKKGVDLGPMMGVPVLIKDNIDLKGVPNTAGSLALADNFPVDDSPLVKQLRKAGAVILGKTKLSEFANFLTSGMPSGYSSLGGQVLNPYDTSQTPSGSSSGTGAGIAAAMGPVGIGTETSGSILSPSNANSLAGVKPTLGLVSRTGIIPISGAQDTAGPMGRHVADVAALLSAMTGVDPADPATASSASLVGHDFTKDLSTTALQGTRIGVLTNGAPTGDSLALWNGALATLQAEGATLVPITLSTAGPASTVLTYDFKADLNTYLQTRTQPNYVMKDITKVADYYRAHPKETQKFGATQLFASEAVDLAGARARRDADRAADLVASKDRIDAVMAANDLDTILFQSSASAGIGAKAGYPTVIVPAGYQASTRRPFGIGFLGKAYTEPALLGFAYDYEQASKLWAPPSEVNPASFRCVGIDEKAAPAYGCAP